MVLSFLIFLRCKTLTDIREDILVTSAAPGVSSTDDGHGIHNNYLGIQEEEEFQPITENVDTPQNHI